MQAGPGFSPVLDAKASLEESLTSGLCVSAVHMRKIITSCILILFSVLHAIISLLHVLIKWVYCLVSILSSFLTHAMTMFYSNRIQLIQLIYWSKWRIKWQKLARKGSFRQYIEPTLFNIKAIGVLERTKRRLWDGTRFSNHLDKTNELEDRVSLSPC